MITNKEAALDYKKTRDKLVSKGEVALAVRIEGSDLEENAKLELMEARLEQLRQGGVAGHYRWWKKCANTVQNCIAVALPILLVARVNDAEGITGVCSVIGSLCAFFVVLTHSDILESNAMMRSIAAQKKELWMLARKAGAYAALDGQDAYDTWSERNAYIVKHMKDKEASISEDQIRKDSQKQHKKSQAVGNQYSKPLLSDDMLASAEGVEDPEQGSQNQTRTEKSSTDSADFIKQNIDKITKRLRENNAGAMALKTCQDRFSPAARYDLMHIFLRQRETESKAEKVKERHRWFKMGERVMSLLVPILIFVQKMWPMSNYPFVTLVVTVFSSIVGSICMWLAQSSEAEMIKMHLYRSAAGVQELELQLVLIGKRKGSLADYFSWQTQKEYDLDMASEKTQEVQDEAKDKEYNSSIPAQEDGHEAIDNEHIPVVTPVLDATKKSGVPVLAAAGGANKKKAQRQGHEALQGVESEAHKVKAETRQHGDSTVGAPLQVWPFSELKRDPSRKVAVVTGAASGMGRAAARLLADSGAQVALADRNVASLAPVEAELRAAGADAKAFRVNLALAGDIKHFAQEVLDHYGKVDILINNAGVSAMAPVIGEDDDFDRAWELYMKVHLLAQVRLVREFAPSLQRVEEGQIVNNTSNEGSGGASDQPLCSPLLGFVALSTALTNKVPILG